MFETSIVIGVFLVALGGSYFFYFNQPEESAAQAEPAVAPVAAEPADLADANPVTDLAILSIDLRPDPTETQALLDIRISNRSRQFAYSEIEYETSYTDMAGNLTSQREGILPGMLNPGDQQNLTGINDGLFPLGASSYSMEIRGAKATLP